MYKCVEIGKQLIEGITRYNEGTIFDISDAGCRLQINFSNPTEQEMKAIKEGKIKIGIYSKGGGEAVILLFKFEDLQWMDAPYSVHLSKKLTGIGEINEGCGLALNIMLVDADTGILKVNRLVGLSTNFSRKLKKTIEKQKELSYEKYNEKINYIYRKYTTKELAQYADLICSIR